MFVREVGPETSFRRFVRSQVLCFGHRRFENRTSRIDLIAVGLLQQDQKVSSGQRPPPRSPIGSCGMQTGTPLPSPIEGGCKGSSAKPWLVIECWVDAPSRRGSDEMEQAQKHQRAALREETRRQR